LEQKSEVASPVNDSLHEKIGSTVVNKHITLLERTHSLEDCWECQVPELHAPFLKVCRQWVGAIQAIHVQENTILGHDVVEEINCCFNELWHTKFDENVIVVKIEVYAKKLNYTIIKRGQFELTLIYQQAFPSQGVSLSSPTGASKNLRANRVGVEEFHQISQETFIWLLVVEVAISWSLPTSISGCKELVA
jgi:hypothetical protein